MKGRFNLRSPQLLIINCSLLIISSCSIEKQIGKSAKEDVLDAKALQTAHIGISIFDPATNKYLYNYQGDKYFVPASNIKLPTCYAAMKYLGDSLVGIKFGIPKEKLWNDLIVFQPTGDPTFLHKDFANQPVFNFLKYELVANKKGATFMDTIWEDQHLGHGWSWNDYNEDYMAERNSFPIYGNVLNIYLNDDPKTSYRPYRNHFKTSIHFFDSTLNKYDNGNYYENENYSLTRGFADNSFYFKKSPRSFKTQTIPFATLAKQTAAKLLNDTLKRKKFDWDRVYPYYGKKNEYTYDCDNCDVATIHIDNWTVIHSQPTDSLLKPMMHRSDNFFAEQSLLMVSNERLGVMNDEKIIDTLLKTDFKDLPQKPRWVDGSGLSRYNLFTPQDFVAILNKMKNEFGMERIKVILPTGGEGTISSYYKADSGYIYGKTGTLSGVVAFSGFLYTKKGKLLIFSTLVNNHQATATEVRRAVEKFLQGVRNRY